MTSKLKEIVEVEAEVIPDIQNEDKWKVARFRGYRKKLREKRRAQQEVIYVPQNEFNDWQGR